MPSRASSSSGCGRAACGGYSGMPPADTRPHRRYESSPLRITSSCSAKRPSTVRSNFPNIMARPSRRPVRRRLGRTALLSLLAIVLVAPAVEIARLDRQIQRLFELRNWTAPTHVYARPLELYEDAAITADELELHLRQLGYEEVAEVGESGTYSRWKGEIELVSRPFLFSDGPQPAQHAYLHLTEGRVTTLLDDDARTPLPILRLDPLRLGRIQPGELEDRILLDPNEIPPLLTTALLEVEDAGFYDHPGVDLRAILRAATVNLRERELRQGGSTLTQQLVKNLLRDRRRTFPRKLREAIAALLLERRYEKEQILVTYINEVYLGQDGERAIHGFGLASRFYFGRPLDRLELHEIALLVGLVRGPSLYDPRAHPQQARQRRNAVLADLVRGERIDLDEAVEAQERPLELADHAPREALRYPAFMKLVRRQLGRQYTPERLARGSLEVFTTLDPLVQNRAERILAHRLHQFERTRGDTLEGALVVCSVADAKILALVGGRVAQFAGFNRALDARRNVGSLIKPIVYLTALESGDYTLTSRVVDRPLTVRLAGGRHWTPGNYDGAYHGEMPLMRALGDSRNLAAVRVGLDVGVARVAEKLRALGLTREVPAYESLLLGGVSLSPLEVAQVYSSLASGGFHAPLGVLHAVRVSGSAPLSRYPPRLTQVARHAAVFQINAALVMAMHYGTGHRVRAQLPEWLEVAGKTGTTNELRDSWFAGFSGDRLGVVWIGRDDHAPVGLSGASGALAVWAELFATIATTSYAPPPPEGWTQVWIDYYSGLLTRLGCGAAVATPVPEDASIAWLPRCDPRR
ncbi:MAG: penicillin-binding protein 1B [Candidatus Eisenbacteria bacterium]|nr:penicillin-binding protein 1B [Candidatus Eisenbacteria bacterium]